MKALAEAIFDERNDEFVMKVEAEHIVVALTGPSGQLNEWAAWELLLLTMNK